MIINIAEPERHTVYDYDLTLDNGFLLSLTIDPTKGDSIEFGFDVVKAFLAKKTSKLNPQDTIPAEEITIYTPHIVVINKKDREEADVTPEQQSSWMETLKKSAGGTVQ